jgi:hypothetical protein
MPNGGIPSTPPLSAKFIKHNKFSAFIEKRCGEKMGGGKEGGTGKGGGGSTERRQKGALACHGDMEGGASGGLRTKGGAEHSVKQSGTQTFISHAPLPSPP